MKNGSLATDKEINGSSLGLSKTSTIQDVLTSMLRVMQTGDYITGEGLEATGSTEVKNADLFVNTITRTDNGFIPNFTWKALALIFLTEFSDVDKAEFKVTPIKYKYFNDTFIYLHVTSATALMGDDKKLDIYINGNQWAKTYYVTANDWSPLFK